MFSRSSSIVVLSLFFFKPCLADVKEFVLIVHHQDVDIVKNAGAEDEEAVSRLGTFVNGTYPGPTLDVNLGDTVHVKVYNDMPKSETAIHFHGQHQAESYFYDGVPHVTQVCEMVYSMLAMRVSSLPTSTLLLSALLHES